MITKNVVAGIVKNEDGKVVLLNHNKLNKWVLGPMGKVDEEDGDIYTALKREAFEELGIEVIAYSLLLQHECICQNQLIKFSIFEVHCYEGIIYNKEPQKHSGITFVNKEELLKLKLASRLDDIAGAVLEYDLL